MSLRIKILSGFLILALMLAVAGVWSIYEIRRTGSSIGKILDDNYRSINAGRTMLLALERENSGVILLLSGKWKQGRTILKEAEQLFDKGFKIASSNITIPGEKEHIERIKKDYLKYKSLWMRPIVGTSHEKDLNWYFTDMYRLYTNVNKSVNDLISMNENMIYQMASKLQTRTHRAVMPGVVAIVSALIFTIIFNYFINYYIVSPILKITEGIRKYIERGVAFNVVVETRDELYDLSNSVKDLVSKLRQNSG